MFSEISLPVPSQHMTRFLGSDLRLCFAASVAGGAARVSIAEDTHSVRGRTA